MASKASMLQKGAKNTGTGLFKGMKPLSAAVDKEEKKEAEPKEAKSEVKEKAPVKKAPEPVKEEPVEKAAEPVAEKVVEKAPEPVAEAAPEPVKVPVEAVSPAAVTPAKEIANEPQPEYPQEPVQYTQPQAQPQVQTPIQPQVQAPVQPQVQATTQYMNQPVMQPQYNNQFSNIQPVSQPVMAPQYNQSYANMQFNQPQMIQQEPARRGRAASGTGEKASRYEKDKFLLLDIRGYRDYVEHMAKAANMSSTKYIRSLIEQDMKKNIDIYQMHKKLEEELRARQ